MITLETIATTKVGLQAQARELDISGRSKMDKETLAHHIREVLMIRFRAEQERAEKWEAAMRKRQNIIAEGGDVTDVNATLATMAERHASLGDNRAADALTHPHTVSVPAPDVFPATVTAVKTGQASCVGCHEVFNVTQTPACATCHPVTVKATPLTVFGIPRARKFKLRRTDSRYRR